MVVLSILFVLGLESLRLPAALLLGPMLAAILVAAAGGAVPVPKPAFLAAQGVIGCMIAGYLPPTLLGELRHDWPVFLAGTLSTIGAASLLGWLLTRARILPGTTAVWGSSPGAATAMTLMAEGYGADMRLVAFMQYLRVVCCAVVASLVSRIWADGTGGSHPAIVWFPALPWPSVAATLAMAGISAFIGWRLRIPGGPLLLPLAVGMVMKAGGWMTIILPSWILALSYALVGWGIGLRFTPAILVHAARVLPRVLASILLLISISGGFAVVLVTAAGIDPLTAYLATSPGGADSVAIIAASSKVDLPFVMAMQVARFVIVVIVGPPLARLIASRNTSEMENAA